MCLVWALGYTKLCLVHKSLISSVKLPLFASLDDYDKSVLHQKYEENASEEKGPKTTLRQVLEHQKICGQRHLFSRRLKSVASEEMDTS